MGTVTVSLLSADGRSMRATMLFVALILSGCTNAPFQSRVDTYAETASDELRLSASSEFVRAKAENYNTKITSFVSVEPSQTVADERSVNYPMSGSDLRRLPPVESSDAMLVDGQSEWSRAYGGEQRPRSMLIPTQWDENPMRLIPTRWDARVVFAGQGER